MIVRIEGEDGVMELVSYNFEAHLIAGIATIATITAASSSPKSTTITSYFIVSGAFASSPVSQEV